jgi:hypothetical protein
VVEGLVLEAQLRADEAEALEEQWESEAAEDGPGEAEVEAVGHLLTDEVQVPRAEERRERELLREERLRYQWHCRR